ncbi:hypothetical protein KIW84_066447 [Lathyrus oleraceus]|uniref:Sacsin/Nov domain-containing protein n=1 Tax=Pisum sativum TaxID=3888 RepID=A0A9D4WHH5_PEA|nr:hypothetical protein KIW84_066445 [Pisum sativum]KAI5401985.1 hypothetical protein KIW84_066446 [Pisum sativum]KAI5401986.1 hypothetical protein KIW84_066447 [Pisum sativum]
MWNHNPQVNHLHPKVNAEDAGASEVIFLLDKSQYGTSSILSPEMADWQGLALYCFNGSVFSPQDLYAISRIGQESKLEKAFAIGRFGLGFNCVYHFTELLHFGCGLQQSFPGTLFRFPLRTVGGASRSQIKKEVYAPENVRSLFAAFSETVSETLLFLHNEAPGSRSFFTEIIASYLGYEICKGENSLKQLQPFPIKATWAKPCEASLTEQSTSSLNLPENWVEALDETTNQPT